MFYGELEARGWTCVGGITGRSELLELARSVGKPVPSPTGELIKELSPVLQPDGPQGHSQRYVCRREVSVAYRHRFLAYPFPVHSAPSPR